MGVPRAWLPCCEPILGFPACHQDFSSHSRNPQIMSGDGGDYTGGAGDEPPQVRTFTWSLDF